MIKIIIEGNPFTVNKQYCTRKGSRKIMLSREAQGYGDNIAWQAKKQFMKISRTPLKENLEVTYHYYFPRTYVNKKIDHLNFNKLLNDRFNQIVWEDDSQIKISHHYTKFTCEEPCTEILIKII